MSKKVAIVCCSNAIKESYKRKVELLKKTLINTDEILLYFTKQRF